MKKSPQKPTNAEIEILQVLWTLGPSNVRTVHEAVARGIGYTTVLKTLQVMSDKGLVRRDESQRAHVYRVTSPKEESQRQLLADLARRAFAGSTSQLIIQALSAKRASTAELREIRKLLDQLTREEK